MRQIMVETKEAKQALDLCDRWPTLLHSDILPADLVNMAREYLLPEGKDPETLEEIARRKILWSTKKIKYI